MSGIQSTKVMCTVEPLRADLEKTEASMKKKKPRENYKDSQSVTVPRKHSGLCENVQVRQRSRRLLSVWLRCLARLAWESERGDATTTL